ncbi:O-antigen polysaccharide polymerase Wzy family protein [Dorea sp. D27]|uniref:O-antigen polysaccharide polymerase Wzy family protein n=1 Tax=Dorea sp. D27 TaxID=658665 RepID=UPI000A00A8A8|nr:O-antigen polysaccharide polymerase Wzy family protein [Dorea sp. D27]
MKKCLRYSVLVLGIIFAILGICLKSYSFALLCTVACFLNNIIYCSENIKNRIFFLMFHIMILVFLLGRPIIELFRDHDWWKEYVKEFGKDSLFFAINALTISLIAMFAGALLAERHKKEKIRDVVIGRNTDYIEKFRNNLQIISAVIFYFSMIAFLMLEVEKLIFMSGRDYVDYYSSFVSHAPYIIHLIAGFMKYSLCIFLGTFPEKKKCYLPLALYLISAIPGLIIGVRNPIMLNAVFIFLYFFIRDALHDKDKWLGKLEKMAIGIGTPAALLFMGAYSSIRVGNSNIPDGIGKLFVSFFYGQGVSFKVLNIGYSCMDILPNRMEKNYTFGGFIDYVTHGAIAQKFFSAEALDSGNSVKNAMLSNNLSHSLAYVSKGDEYITGHGWGSSYLLETFIDFGYWGIAVYSFLLAYILIKGMRIIKKNSLTATIFLFILTQIFFVPRAEATGFLDFTIQIGFWLAVVICYLMAGLCCKKYEFVKT